MKLHDVQTQWQRVIFMQTNREDLGDRYRLIEIPYTNDKSLAESVSKGYKDFFIGLDLLRQQFEKLEKKLL